MKLVLVLVDALKSNYLTAQNMPFLFDLSNKSKYIRNVIPSPGFCERSEIFTGLDCYDSGNFSAIGYDPSNSDYKREGVAVKLASFASIFNKRGARFLLRQYRSLKHLPMKPYCIPYSSLNKFTLTEDGKVNRIHHETLFDQLNKASLSYTLESFTSLSEIVSKRNVPLQDFLETKLSSNIDFIPIYIGDIDTVGHKCGEDIAAIRPKLIDVDNLVGELYEISQKHNCAFAVLGDHGMVPVIKYVDVAEVLDAHNFKLHTKYEMFLDSTIARFWFYDENIENEVRTILESELNEFGTIVDESNFKNYRIPLDLMSKEGKPVYGEMLWCANPGVLISPDYFHPRAVKYKGMHGYLNTHMEDGTGLFVSTRPGQDNEALESIHLKEICGELCDLLEVTRPNTEEWRREII